MKIFVNKVREEDRQAWKLVGRFFHEWYSTSKNQSKEGRDQLVSMNDFQTENVDQN